MRDYTAEPGGGYVEIEDGIYGATVQEIREQETQYGSALKFIFAAETEDGDVELSALCNDPETLSPKTKLRKWANAILNREIQDGETFNPKMLLDQPCRILVKNETGENGTWARVKDVMPRRKGKKKANDDVDEFLKD